MTAPLLFFYFILVVVDGGDDDDSVTLHVCEVERMWAVHGV